MKKVLVHIIYLVIITGICGYALIQKSEAEKNTLEAQANASLAMEAANKASRAAAEALNSQNRAEEAMKLAQTLQTQLENCQ